MIKHLTLALLLLALLAAPAYAAEYWVVIPEDGTSVDVVNGMNFAASMKGSVAVQFTSKSDGDARAASITTDFDELVAVIFEGDEAVVLRGTLPEFDRVVEGAVVYLEREGFDVEVRPADVSEFYDDSDDERLTEGPDIFGDPDVDEYEEEPEPIEVITPEVDDEVLVEGDPDQPIIKGNVPNPEEDEPNVFVKFFRWFARLF